MFTFHCHRHSHDIHGIQINRTTSAAAYLLWISLLSKAECFIQLTIHRGKGLVRPDAALAALVAADVPTPPEVALVVAAKTIVEVIADLDLP